MARTEDNFSTGAPSRPPPLDGLHWKPVAKVFETFRERYGILAEEKFSEQMDKWWYRWTTAAGLPRQFTHTVLPLGTRIDIDDELDLDCEDEMILIRLNGEPCYGWLAVWDPPAAVVSESPRVSPTQSEPGGAPPPQPPPSMPAAEPSREVTGDEASGASVESASVAAAPPSASAAEPPKLPQVWFREALQNHRRQPGETKIAYANRLHGLMQGASLTRMWLKKTVRRRLDD